MGLCARRPRKTKLAAMSTEDLQRLDRLKFERMAAASPNKTN